MRFVVTLMALLSVVTLGDFSIASAQSRAERRVKQKMQAGMEHYDLADFDDALESLNDALSTSKQYGLEQETVTAEVYLRLGIVYFAGKEDPESAKLSFINAVKINPDVEINKVYSRPDMEVLFDKVRNKYAPETKAKSRSQAKSNKQAGGAINEQGESELCEGVRGITHAAIDEAISSEPPLVEAFVSPKLKASRVILHYRSSGTKFDTVAMQKEEGCRFSATIPKESLNNSFVSYYIAAYNKRGKVIARKGSAGSPNPISIEKVDEDEDYDDYTGVDENPLLGGGGKATKSRKKRRKKKRRPGENKYFVSFGLGSGIGVATGQTEQLKEDIVTGFAPAWLHILPEVGYYVEPHITVSIAGRLGLTLGANQPNHATASPAVLLRGRYGLQKRRDGLGVIGSIGGGFLRQVLTVNKATNDRDTTVSGPLIAGAGLGYQKPLSNMIRFNAEANMYLGIPIADLGGIEPNFGSQFDVNVGFMFAF